MIFGHLEKYPKIHPSAHIAPNAVISGDVEIDENSVVGFGAVITADSGPVRIGSNAVIMENAIIRGVRNDPVNIGANVLVGPQTHISGCTIAENVFVATGAVILNGAHLGERSEVRINGIVHIRTRLERDSIVPLGWIAVGDPARILPPDRHEEIWEVQKLLDFPGYVFGEPRPVDTDTMMPSLMPRYAAALIQRHRDDRTMEQGAEN